MSHFFGFVSFTKSIAVNLTAKRMKDSMSFFPCDGSREFVSDKIFICNQFLNISPEAKTFPSLCENNQFILAATVRLDNREELSQKLSCSLELSDHEYLLAAYSKWKEQCVNHLLGDFSFIVWDKVNEQLFLAKDHLGIRPLFYLERAEGFFFATSIHALKSAFNEHLPLNDTYIAKALGEYTFKVEETFFKDIIRLKPAHYAILDSTGLGKEQQYWELAAINLSAYPSPETLIDELKKLLQLAVECRLRTHKNIGSQLSGGLDSSALAVLASRIIDKDRLHTFSFVLNDFTASFSELKVDEKDTQNEIINYAALKKENHHPITEFYFKDLAHQYDVTNTIMGGYANADTVWQDAIFKAAKEYNVGICISGFPGDECVSANGTLYYYDYFKLTQFKALLKLLKEEKLVGLKKIVNYFRAMRKGTTHFNFEAIAKERSMLNEKSIYHKKLKTLLFEFQTTFKKLLKSRISQPHVCFRPESEGAYALQYGIETVYPLADIRLITFIYSLPTSMFKPDPMPRMVFRKMCEGILPDSVRLQPKYNGAFTLAFAEYWIELQVAQFQKVEVTDYNNLFDMAKFQRLWEEYKMNKDINPPVIIHQLAEFIKRNTSNY